MYKKLIDGKPVIVKANSKNIPPLTEIKKVYAKIPDNKRIPIVFQTKEQYLDEYIKNQEKAKKIKFPEWQKKQYKQEELKNMKNIVSRYTTNHNPYIDRRVVFFNDNKIPVKQFHDSALHEYGHELWEKNPKLRRDWKSVSRTTSPTSYGATSKQEDFAESFMLAKTGRLQDPKRERILSDAVTANRVITPWHGNIESQTIQNPNFRKIAFTGNHAQISLMSLKPGQDIGLEKHDKVDQFFRVEQGKAEFVLDKGKTRFIEGPSGAAMIPANTWHNIRALGNKPLKLYSIYSPPHHPAGIIQKDKITKNYNDNEDPTIEIERWNREALLEQTMQPEYDPTMPTASDFEQEYSTTTTDFNPLYAKGILGGGYDTAIKTILPYSNTPEFKYKVLGDTKTYNPVFETSDLGGKVNLIAGRRIGNAALADKLALSDVDIPTFGGQVKEVTKDRKSWNRGIALRDTRKHKYGTIAWQEAMEHNINEKMRLGEDFGPGERAFIRHNQEWRPEDVEITFKPVKKDEDSEDMAIEWKKEKGRHYKDMSPTEYLERTGRTLGINENTGERTYINKNSRMHKQDDEGQTVQEFSEDILNPNKTIKVEAPFLYTEGEYAQEGRHRALGAEIAGLKTIPVATNTPEEYRGPEVFEKFKEKMLERGHRLTGYYGEEWKERFKKRPETYMGEEFREGYKDALKDKGLNPKILYEEEEKND